MTKNIKQDDWVISTDLNNPECLWLPFRVLDVGDNEVVVDNYQFSFYVDQLEVLEPYNPKAIPGDIIIVVNTNLDVGLVGKKFIVKSKPSYEDYISLDCVWSTNPTNGRSFYINHGSYYVLKRSSISVSMCNDCHGTGKIELFTSIVKCDCRRG